MSVPYDEVAPSPTTGYVRPGRLSQTVPILLWVTTAVQVVVAISEWQRYFASKDDPQSYDSSSVRPLDVVALVVMLVTATVFISWLRRARLNAESLCRAPHRHDRPWVIAGWIVPVLWFWYPKQIVDDIVVASSPETPRDAEVLPMEQTRVVLIWWAAWLGNNLLDISSPLFQPDLMTAGAIAGSAALTTAATLCMIVAAVYGVRVIRYVDELQEARSVAR